MRYLIFLLLFIGCLSESPEVSDPKSITTLEILETADTAVISLIDNKLYILENNLVTQRYFIKSKGRVANQTVAIIIILLCGAFVGFVGGLTARD